MAASINISNNEIMIITKTTTRRVIISQEGSCALTGLSYNGRDAHAGNLWDGLQNIWVWRFEMTTNFDGFIRAFNINTNKWVAQYIFKRLKFLGNDKINNDSNYSNNNNSNSNSNNGIIWRLGCRK